MISYLKITLFLLLSFAVLAACRPSTVEPIVVDDIPVVQQAHGPKIRIQNNFDEELASVSLNFGETGLYFNDIAAGAKSNYTLIDEAYQSVSVTAQTTNGQSYINQPLDRAGEINNPITAGSYTIIVSLNNNTLMAEWQPEMSVELLPLLTELQTSDTLVTYEPSIKRGSLFNELMGDNLSFMEILQINGQRLDVYVFDTPTIAKEAATAIKYGGTEFEYTQENGQTVNIFADVEMGTLVYYWQYKNYILHTDDEGTAEIITAALQTQPLYDPTKGAPLQVAIANVSNHTYDNLLITMPDGTGIGSGNMPTGAIIGFNPVQQAYPYAPISVTIDGQTYEQPVRDYVGVTPLADGRYIYAVDAIEGQIFLAVLREDELLVDESLLGRWEWSNGTTAAGEPLMLNFAGQPPYLEFTADPEPNGEGGLLFGGYSSCNELGGSYFVSEQQQLVITGIAMTQRGCEDAVQQSEQLFTTALQGITQYMVSEELLTLTTAAGYRFNLTYAEESMASTPLKGYQIFSWQQDDEWLFALLVGTNRLKTVEEIQAHALSLEALSTAVRQLPARSELHWPDSETAALLTSDGEGLFDLPPDTIISEIMTVSQTADLQLSVGGYQP